MQPISQEPINLGKPDCTTNEGRLLILVELGPEHLEKKKRWLVRNAIERYPGAIGIGTEEGLTAYFEKRDRAIRRGEN